MKRLLLGLGLALSLIAGALAQPSQVGPPNAIVCNQWASASPASATTTSVKAGVAGQKIFICGWHVTSTQSGSTTFQLEYGTQGGPCTSPTTITPAFSVTSTAPSGDHQSFASIDIPAGAQLCVVTTGATVAQAIVVFLAQF